MKRLLLFLALLPAVAMAYDFNYKVVDNEAVVTRSDNAKGEVVIPASITVGGVKYPVTAIADSAFYRNYNVTAVKLPKTIKSIGMLAFFGTNIQEPVYTKEIFAFLPEAYEGEYKMPKTITTIADGAFFGCGGLTAVQLPKKLESIGEMAFYATSLTHPVYSATDFVYCPYDYKGSFTIPEGITHIGKYAFVDCEQLEEVIMPASVRNIDSHAFLGCRRLISVVLPPELDQIGDSAFYACQWLSRIDFSKSVIRHIGTSAFYNCVALQTVVLNEGCLSIGDLAFDQCNDLHEVKVPASLESVGINVFEHTKIEEPIYSTRLFIRMPESATGTYTVPDGIEKIAARAFRFCQKLNTVVLPSSLKEIGREAFNFTMLGGTKVPEGVKVDPTAFEHCK